MKPWFLVVFFVLFQSNVFAQVPSETAPTSRETVRPAQPTDLRSLGERQIVRAMQMELERDFIPSSNYGVETLEQVIVLPRSDDNALQDYARDVNATWSPLLLEVGRRTGASNPEEAAYLIWLGRERIRYDAAVCTRSSAQALVPQYFDLMGRQPDYETLLFDPEWAHAAITRLLQNRAMFAGRVSAQYLCSDGYLAEAMLGSRRMVPLGEWRIAGAEIDAVQTRTIERLIGLQRYYASMRAAFLQERARAGEVETGRINVVGRVTPTHLRRISLRPASEDQQVLTLLGDDLSRMPGPYIMERGRRMLSTDRASGLYTYWFGVMRTLWEAQHCRANGDADAAANDYARIYQTDQELERWRRSEEARAMSRAVLSDPQLFETQISPWYLCEKALMIAADRAEGRVDALEWVERPSVPLAEWRVSEDELALRRDNMVSALTGSANR